MNQPEVLFTPADFSALRQRDLSRTTCIVFDVFRATSSLVMALNNGAEAIIPVAEISEALAIREKDPTVLLAGERDGLRIHGGLTGGVEFDSGNSPREFTREKVAGRTIAMTTTNGTRALRACAAAPVIFAGAFLNLTATADAILHQRPENLLVICAGTFEHTAYEDVLGAGALCHILWSQFTTSRASDSALMARELFLSAQTDLPAAASRSRNGRRLLGIPELRDDVAFCLQRDTCNFAASVQSGGKIRKASR